MNDRVSPGSVFKLILIGLAIEAACYLAPASMHITAWPSGGAQAVALLPRTRGLLAGLVVAPLVLGACLLIARRATPDASRRERVRWVADALSPLLLLGLLVLPYVPGVVSRVPAAILFAGPAKWIVIALAVGGCATRPVTEGRTPVASPTSEGPKRTLVFVVSLLIYLALGIPFSRVEGPGSDEPHYLVITQSLLADRDLQIENNHRQRDYAAFVSGELPPHFLRRGLNGVIYSVHAPGLPALLLPGYAAAGYAGAVVTMVLLAALVALAVYDLAWLVAPGRPAFLAWIAVAFTVPLAPHAWLIYPELPAALLAAWAALWLWRRAPEKSAVWIARGAALALWPWLHTKFLVLLVVALACFLVKLRSRLVQASALIAPIAASLTAWLFMFWWMYGIASPFAQYGSSADLAIANVGRGVLGLLFDYKFGVFPYSPIFAVALIGAWRLLRDVRTRWTALALLLLGAGLLASVTPYTMWWGGRSAPARFIVPGVPFVVPMLAAGMSFLSRTRGRPAVAAALGWSVCLFGLMAIRPDLGLLFNERQAPGRLVTLLQGDAPLTFALPTFAQPAYQDDVRKLAIWGIALVAGAMAAWMVAVATPDRRSRRLFRGAIVWLSVVWVTGASVSALVMSRTDRDEHINHTRMRLMSDYDADRLAVAYPSMTRLTTPDLMRRCTLSVETIGIQPRRGERPVIAGPFRLEPGSFTARIWLRNSQHEYDGAITLMDRPYASLVARREGPLRNPIEVPFSLPVANPGVRVEASDWSLAAETVLVEIEPRAVTSRSERERYGRRTSMYQLGGREGAYVVYPDGSTFPEGDFYWTKGGEPGRTLVAPAGAGRLRLTLNAGPKGNDVALDAGGHQEVLRLAPGETRVWERSLDPALTLVPVTITTSAGFRPAGIDPESSDHRWLGCQVRTELRDR